jgi:hypothetical protein
VRVNHYPDERSRKENRPAGAFTATPWSDAPGAGNRWVLPAGCPSRSDSMITVTTRSGETFYVGRLPQGVTYA